MDKSKFPKELLALACWLCWRLVPNPSGGKPKKVPISLKDGSNGQVNNPSTWGTFEEAVTAKEKYGYSGVGFVFREEDGYVAIDIDDCFTDGELNEIGKAILAKAPKTYIEKSPSGGGLHMIVKGKLPGAGRRNDQLGLEIYATKRYFTMTGDHWNGCADVIAEDNGIVDYVYKLACSKPKGNETTPASIVEKVTATVLTDEDLLKLAHASKDGVDFGKLYRGEWQGMFKSQSEADFALCRKLAFWSGRNETQIDRIFRTSNLMREKWGTPHFEGGATYGAKTINNACAITKSVYKPKRAKKSNTPNAPNAVTASTEQGTQDQNEQEEPEIVVHRDCYYRNKGDKFYQITNFIVEPIQMLEYEDGAQMSATFITNRGERFQIHLDAPNMADLRAYKLALSKKTFSLTFLGGNGDLDQFKMFLCDMGWIKKRGAKAMGIYPRKQSQSLVFVDTNGAVGAGGVKDDSIVQLENFKEIKSDILKAPLIDKVGLLLIAKHIMSYNEPAKTVPILAWTAGCFIKPHLKKIKIKFAHLFLVGERGGGKSNSMERIIMPMMGNTQKQAASQVTPFSVARDSNSSNVIPMFIEEFKPSKIAPKQLNILHNHFRDSYDCSSVKRGRPDQTVYVYDLLAPIAVAGEESADESAIRERAIELLFSKRDLQNDNHKASFKWICDNENLVRSFGRSLMDTALQTTTDDVISWFNEGKEFFSTEHASRIRDNLSAMYAGICLVGKLCASLGVSFAEAFPYDNEECAKYLDASVREYLLDDSTYNKGIIESTFEVMARMKLKLGADYCFDNNNQYITIALSDVYDRYTKYLKDFAIKGESLDYNQFCKQLRKTDYYVNSNYKKRMAKESKRVWTINFEKLSANCDVSGFIREEEENGG